MDVREVGEMRDGLHPDTLCEEIAELDMTPDVAGGLRLDPQTLQASYQHFVPAGHRTQLRRWQILTVRKPEGGFRKFIRDLGPASQYPPNSEVLIFSASTNTAAELMAMAEEHRNEGWKRGRDAIGEYEADHPESLAVVAAEQAEYKRKLRKRNRVTASRN